MAGNVAITAKSTVTGQQEELTSTGGVLNTGASGGGGAAVTIADGSDVTFGAKADSAATTDTGTFTFLALFKRALQSLTSMLAGLVNGRSASGTFTPAATSHTAGSCNGAAATFALGAPSAGVFMITNVSLLINSATAEATAWRLYLYSVTPPSAYADGAAWDLTSGDQASYLGYIDLGTAVDLGSTQWVEAAFVNKAVKLAGTGLFGYLVNATTLTPAAVAHTVTLTGVSL